MSKYVVQKESGSRWACVINTVTSVQIAKYDVLKKNGWADADKHCKRLNEADGTGGAS